MKKTDKLKFLGQELLNFTMVQVSYLFLFALKILKIFLHLFEMQNCKAWGGEKEKGREEGDKREKDRDRVRPMVHSSAASRRLEHCLNCPCGYQELKQLSPSPLLSWGGICWELDQSGTPEGTHKGCWCHVQWMNLLHCCISTQRHIAMPSYENFNTKWMIYFSRMK